MSEARHNFEAADQNLQFRVREAYAQAQTAWRLIQLYADTILPQSALTIESSLASYETGGTDFLSVLTNVMDEGRRRGALPRAEDDVRAGAGAAGGADRRIAGEARP